MANLSVPYDDVGQSDMRLRESIILVDGQPVQVMGSVKRGKKLFIQYARLPAKNAIDEIDLQDETVNIRDFKLGYLNHRGEALYLSRIPGRQQVQGLCRRNVDITAFSDPRKDRPEWGQIIRTGEFSDMMRGVYPKYKDCVASLEHDNERVSVAFSRVWALRRDNDLGFFELLFKGERVAWGDPNQFNLPSASTYLRECLDEANINYRQ